jgi:hypothetical protein
MRIKYDLDQLAMLANGEAIPLEVEKSMAMHDCPNCLDVKSVFVFKVKAGPFKSPPGGKCKKFPETFVDGKKYPAGWYAGEMVGSRCPICSEGKILEYYAYISGLTGKELTINLANFATMSGKEEARSKVENYLSMGKSICGYLTLWGGYGVGKSMLLKCLVNGSRVRQVQSKYIRAVDLLDSIRDRFGDNSNSASDAIEELRDYPVLCIDEIDKIKLTDWARQVLFQILDSRYEDSNNIFTAIAMNISPDLLPPELKYLASRMSGGEVVQVGGVDCRPGSNVNMEWINQDGGRDD